MTDRVKGCWVTFEKDIRTDDAECILKVIRMLRFVAGVSIEDTVTDHNDWMNRTQIRQELSDVACVAIRTLLEGDPGFVYDKTRTIKALEKVVARLREKDKY